jgi:hypothetical protein
MSRSFEWYSLRLSNNNFVCISHAHAHAHATCPAHLILYHVLNYKLHLDLK